MRDSGSLHRLWRGEGGLGPSALGIVAAPLAAVFGTGVRTRNLLYDLRVLRSSPAPLPVISIGNLAVGGSGKTPVAAWLVRQLLRRGWKPALVTRGYGQDEVLLHRRWNPEAPVIVARRRLDGVREAVGLELDIVVADDAFQHRQMSRDVDAVLLSPIHPLPPRLLPRGPFREPLRALRRAQFILVTSKGNHELQSARRLATELRQIPGLPPVGLFTFSVGEWQDLDGSSNAPPPLGAPLVVSSIAEPEGFCKIVGDRVGAAPEALSYPDHHAYSETDAKRISGLAGSRWIATTEKDAVKLVSFRELLPVVRVLPLVPTAEEALADRLLRPLGTRAPAQELE